MDREIDRRELLGYAGIGAGALILGGVAVDPVAGARARRRRVPLSRAGNFPQGVASGSPSTRGISLWTRLGGHTRDRKIRLEVARDPDFSRVVKRRTLLVRAGRDHTVEARVAGKFLKPGEEYFYRFESRTRSSEVGRFQTLRPRDSRQPVRIAFFSCQDWVAGYYPAHKAIAAEDVDFVVCLGDYIYEQNFYEGPRTDRLGANRDSEVHTLPEYRAKYRMYKADPNLRAMHAAHAFGAIWDDHEVEDNFAGSNPGDKTMDRRIPFLQRQRNGYRAFYEFMPFKPVRRDPERGSGLYRRMRFGANVELFLLDQRNFRDEQPCGDLPLVACPSAETEPRRLLGDRQLAWLKRRLEASGATWKLVGNQVMIMRLEVGPESAITKDSWDGYGRERRELLEFVRAKGIRNLSFLTGDIHTFFAGDVGINGRGPDYVATEFVGGSITSGGFPETLQGPEYGVPLTREQIQAITTNVRTANPHIKFQDQDKRGYGILEATRSELNVTFKSVNALVPRAPARTLKRFRVASGTPRVQLL